MQGVVHYSLGFLVLLIHTVLVLFFRPGASSGIFLGAVTLPGLMVSKLIQMSRAISLNQVGSEGRTLIFEQIELL